MFCAQLRYKKDILAERKTMLRIMGLCYQSRKVKLRLAVYPRTGEIRLRITTILGECLSYEVVEGFLFLFVFVLFAKQ